MKFYRITTTASVARPVRWVASQADAASTRKELIQAGASRASITTDEIDVPTDKPGLFTFLNKEAV